MEKKQETKSSSPAPFLHKTYEMVDDYSTDHIVSWSHSGCSFVVWDPPEFSQDLLAKYFKHNNFSSFVRQLNTYGFRKVDPDQWEFANPDFVKGKRDLLKNIHRRKPIHSHSSKGNSSALTETERLDYYEEIRRLEREKYSLQMELQRQDQEREQFKLESSALGQRLVGMETRQMHLMSFLDQLIQKQGFLKRQSQSHNRKRRLPQVDQLLQVNSNDPHLIKHFEMVEKMDSFLTLWETFLNEIPHQELSVDVGAPSSKRFMTTGVASGASSYDAESCSSKSVGIPSSPELVECFFEILSPLPATNQSAETFQDSSILRVDSNAPPSETKKLSDSDARICNELIGVNDHFWQRFLTEAPDSADS